jgi:hypothetical protein
MRLFPVPAERRARLSPLGVGVALAAGHAPLTAVLIGLAVLAGGALTLLAAVVFCRRPEPWRRLTELLRTTARTWR